MVLFPYGVSYLIENPPPHIDDSQYLKLDAHVALVVYSTLVGSLIDHIIGATTTHDL